MLDIIYSFNTVYSDIHIVLMLQCGHFLQINAAVRTDTLSNFDDALQPDTLFQFYFQVKSVYYSLRDP